MFDFTSAEKEVSLKFENVEMKIVYLYYVEKYSIRQITKELKCASETVRKALNKSFGVRDKKKALELRSTDEYREKLRVAQLGESNNQARFTESDVLAIRAEYPKLQKTFTKTQSQYLLAKEYGVKRPTISDIVLNKSWKHI